MLGTEWVGPEQGATVEELLQASPAYILTTFEARKLYPFLRTKTTLRFTGETIKKYDLERIQEALRRVQEPA